MRAQTNLWTFARRRISRSCQIAALGAHIYCNDPEAARDTQKGRQHIAKLEGAWIENNAAAVLSA